MVEKSSKARNAEPSFPTSDARLALTGKRLDTQAPILFRIDYRQGKANGAADALSRFSSEDLLKPERGGRSSS